MGETPRDPMIDRFAYQDQPLDLQPIATVFSMLAGWICASTRPGPARLDALDQLLDARAAAFRAHMAPELTRK